MAKRVSRRPSMAGQFPSISAVFYRRAVELEASNFAPRAEILGIMLAHDIGHLLLAENSHSEQGILRARWSDQDLKLIAQGRSWFTPAEVARIADNNSRRRFWENVADPAILRIAGWEDAGPARQRSF
jgi:hypothetical protein